MVLLLKVRWSRDRWELELEPELRRNVDISISNVSTGILPIMRGWPIRFNLPWRAARAAHFQKHTRVAQTLIGSVVRWLVV